MRSLFFWAWTAFPTVVYCDNAIVEVEQAPRQPKCGIQGNRYLRPFLVTSQPSFSVEAQCGALCKSQQLCQSYSIEGSYCRLYSLPASVPFLTNQRSGNIKFYDKFCERKDIICQAAGYRSSRSKAYSSSTKISDNNFAACRTLCNGSSGCGSFSVQLETGGSCRLYKTALVRDFTPDAKSLNLFWDITCPRNMVVSGPELVKDPPDPKNDPPLIEAKVEPPVFEPHPNPPTVVAVDSPPYVPVGPQVPPEDDDEFIENYKFEQFELPPVDNAGQAPITTGIPQPTGLVEAPCMVNPKSKAEFSIVNENFLPMVSRASDSIGPLQQPTAPPEKNSPLLDFASLKLPGFHLQEVQGVNGLYDIVYNGPTAQKFVAMNKKNEIVLTDKSTGTSFANDVVTTLFSVDCFGIISITHEGKRLRWETVMSSSKFVLGADRNLKALPKVIPEFESAKKNLKRNMELANTLRKRSLRKRSYTDGPAPKCPAQPPNLKPLFKQGYKQGEGNFCESLSDWWGISPYSFDGSCEIQSICYDQCPDMGWVSCNAIFGTSMYLSCLSEFDSWWEVVSAIACAAQASYFVGVAATSKGRELFYKAQKSMCRCFCQNPPDTCLFTNGDFYCADINGYDDSNCGNCGRRCGPNSKCRKGVCGCPQDQCGTTCIDFRNNPNYCGSCATKCDPAYCVSGRCYKPVPGECLPDQPVTNNNFEQGFYNWTKSAYPGCTLDSNINFYVTRYISQGHPNGEPAALVEMTSLPAAGCQAALVQTQVKMCAGFKYELKFAMGYVNQVGNDAVVSDADCIVRWLTGKPSSWDGLDGFQRSPEYKIGKSNPTYQTFGPWSLSVAEGQTGVTKRKKDLLVDLTAVIHCYKTGGAARFILRAIELNQVGTTRKRSLNIDEEPLQWLDNFGSSSFANQAPNGTEQDQSTNEKWEGEIVISRYVPEKVTQN